MADLLITVKDVPPKYCYTGVRHVFTQYGLDFKLFIRQGIPASLLEKTGDPVILEFLEELRTVKEADNGVR